MSTSNPVLSRMRPQSSERTLTLDAVITRTLSLLTLVIILAAGTWSLSLIGLESLTTLLGIVGSVGTLIMVIAVAFKKNFASPVLTITYTFFEGLFVGGMTYILTQGFSSSVTATLIGQAILATVVTFAVMLLTFKKGWITVTSRFNHILGIVLWSILGLSLVNLATALIFDFNPLRDGGPIAIVFSLICIVVGALTLLSDFDATADLIEAGVPESASWHVALGLIVSIVWLYVEFLRLFASRR